MRQTNRWTHLRSNDRHESISHSTADPFLTLRWLSGLGQGKDTPVHDVSLSERGTPALWSHHKRCPLQSLIPQAHCHYWVLMRMSQSWINKVIQPYIFLLHYFSLGFLVPRFKKIKTYLIEWNWNFLWTMDECAWANDKYYDKIYSTQKYLSFWKSVHFVCLWISSRLIHEILSSKKQIGSGHPRHASNWLSLPAA